MLLLHVSRGDDCRGHLRCDRDAESVHHLAGGPLTTLDPAVQLALTEGRGVLSGEVDRPLTSPRAQKSVYWPGPNPV